MSGVCQSGQCIQGVLSPRMGLRLQEFATAASGMVGDSWPKSHAGGSLHDPSVYLLDYVPVDLRLEVSHAFVVGFSNCMATFAYLLRQKQFPKPALIRQCIGFVPGLDKGATASYFQAGGRPEYAIDAVLARCEEDVVEAASLGMVEDGVLQEALEALPACPMDDRFDLVRQALFQNSAVWPCGPYSMDEEQYQGDDGWVHYDTSGWSGQPGQ
ncbi:hypothetical protein ACKKBF_B16635 [Auxenochlorella protothecoides x Auxenochlorella symbiontica]